MSSIKEMIDTIKTLNTNILNNTKQNARLEGEVKATRETDEKNRIFLENLVTSMLENQQTREKNTWGILTKVLDWVLRIGLILLGVVVGLKYLNIT